MTIEGGCICGAVRYRIDEESPPCYACYCTDCQRRSGSSHALILPIWRNRFTVEGETMRGARKLGPGVAATSYSCALCLTELYSHNEQLPDLVIVRAGTRDDSKELVPAAFMWTQSKQPWIEFPPGARKFETQPNGPTIWMDILEMGRRSE